MRRIDTKPGVDEAHAGTGVLYFTYLTSKASQSRISNRHHDRYAVLPLDPRMQLGHSDSLPDRWPTTCRRTHSDTGQRRRSAPSPEQDTLGRAFPGSGSNAKGRKRGLPDDFEE